MTRQHTCYVCKKTFHNAIYWYDSLHDTKHDRRIIRPFCGPVCANRYREISDENDYPQRRPLPHGDEWRIIQDIDHIDYSSD